MIAYVKGKIRLKSPMSGAKKDRFLVIETGGVGYKVLVLEKLWLPAALGQETEVFVYTQVAETVLDLYGFGAPEELEFFEILISLSGIGPRSALDILNKAKIEDLKKAAGSGQFEVLSKVSGLGPKTAQKVVLGLKEKLGGLEAGDEWGGGFGDALEALIGLGYPAYQAREALGQCSAADMGEKVKQALKILGRG